MIVLAFGIVAMLAFSLVWGAAWLIHNLIKGTLWILFKSYELVEDYMDKRKEA